MRAGFKGGIENGKIAVRADFFGGRLGKFVKDRGKQMLRGQVDSTLTDRRQRQRRRIIADSCSDALRTASDVGVDAAWTGCWAPFDAVARGSRREM